MSSTPDSTSTTDHPATEAPPPAWTVDCTPRRAFAQGLRTTPWTPGFILFCAMIGFGALARDAGFSMGHGMFMSAGIFQLPGQVALVDQVARDASFIGAALAVVFTAIRLLPMTVVVMPYLRGSGLPRWMEYAASHFIAITAWVEALQRLPRLPPHVRLPYFLGFSIVLCLSTVVATMLGYFLAAELPPLLGAALLFLTPIYFILSLIAAAMSLADRLAIVFGVILGPVFFLLIPGLDLLGTGLIGGTLAYLIGRLQRSAEQDQGKPS